ncbi:MAG: sulfatase-like hydrolase/transferase [candidate division Zixibacteria bacterium]|nr:sulfatase-like hydrolase/transferase [candidate division Zixibacteria bacterium]
MAATDARISFLTPPRAVLFLAVAYLLGLCFFLIYRLTFLAIFAARAGEPAFADIVTAFVVGFRFDTVVLLLALLPALVVLPWVKLNRTWSAKTAVGYLTLIFSLLVLGMLADIRYYNYFDTHLNFQALQYLLAGGKTTWHVTVTEPFFWPAIILWLLVSVLIFVLVRKLVYAFARRHEPTRRLHTTVWFLIVAALTVFGIRGRTGISPIDWGVAYISDNPFINQLGLNGIYTFGKAFKEEGHDPRLVYIPERFRYPFVPIDAALDTVQAMLALPNDRWLEPERSLLRETSNPARFGFQPNVIIVLMESWTGRYTGALGSDLNLTPRFDSLAAHGILFDQFYATGSRTNYGMAGTLCAFPSLPGRSILDRYNARHPFVALPAILEQRRYTNLLAYGGDLAFDNMQGFFKTQGMHRFCGEKEYGTENIFAKWGIPDEVVFTKTVRMIDSLPRPYSLTLLTLSNHEPFDLPDSSIQIYFDDSEESRVRNAHRYADHALGLFMDSMATLPSFDSTIFLFASDHNKLEPAVPTPHPLQFRVPMLIYAPKMLGDSGRVISTVGGQTDIIPTLMGLLGGTYTHASWGRDLLGLDKDDPGFASICMLNKTGLVEGEYVYTEWIDLPPSFYRVSELDRLVVNAIDRRNEAPADYARMQRRLRIFMQLADQLSTPLQK